MAKLSGPMIDALRMLARGEQCPAGPTRAALLRRGYATWLTDEWTRNRSVEITRTGWDALIALGDLPTGAPAVEAKPTERATFRPADEITMTTGDAGPSVRLTPAPARVEREATDAEVLQLCAVLDAGGSVHRALYQQWGVLDAGPFRLNLDAVNRAARDAVRFALARQTFKGGEYTLTAEPIHLDAGNGHSACGFPLAGYTIRHRVTSDPSKVTHERCKR